jgi:hypothetical protein
VNNRSFGREKLEGGELIGWQLKSRHRSKQVPKRAASEERSLSRLELDLAKKNLAALEGTEPCGNRWHISTIFTLRGVIFGRFDVKQC